MISGFDPRLIEEHDFSFNRTKVPQELLPLLVEIENNKRKWKSLYMAVWGLPLYYLKPELIDKGKGDELKGWGLPASRLKQVLYTPNELNNYLTNYDHGIYISQLIHIFTLLENYFFEYYEVTGQKSESNQNLDFTTFSVLRKYLRDNSFADDKELLELELAKETRNSFVHRRGLVNKRWLDVYKKTKRKNNYKIGDKISIGSHNDFHDLEDWTDLMIKIVEISLTRFV